MNADRPGLFTRLDGTGVPLLLARLVVGGLFLKMGLAKLEDPVAFLKLVRQYDLIPASQPTLLNAVAIIVPWLEVWLGGLMILGVALNGSFLLSSALLIVFTAAVAQRALGLAADQAIPFCEVAFDCGCGGGVVRACAKLPENLGLLLLSVWGVFTRSERLCLRARLWRSHSG